MNKESLAAKTKAELLRIAKRLQLRGISMLKKNELVEKILAAQFLKQSNPKRRALADTAAAAVKKVTEVVRRRAGRKRPGAAKPEAQPPSKIARKPESGVSVGLPGPGESVSAAEAAATAAHKFDVTPKARLPKRKFAEEPLGELPESYGTAKLFLIARDPHWLYAYWDLTRQQMDDLRRRAADGRVLLRLFEKNIPAPVQELTLTQEARNWYISGVRPATTYHAHLGCWLADGRFHIAATSSEATTPPAVVSTDTTVRFATIPVDVPLEELLRVVRAYTADGQPLAEALHRLQRQGVPFPFKVMIEIGPWSAEQAAVIERELGGDLWQRLQVGSLEFSEWLRRRLEQNISSANLGSAAV
ncbi:MAG: DUF4912 domain-containing protein [Verrucomicrobiae bacterium]|nr:DUF4912 domain-containing protein [Verrucomicrobiae bacterium]